MKKSVIFGSLLNKGVKADSILKQFFHYAIAPNTIILESSFTKKDVGRDLNQPSSRTYPNYLKSGSISDYFISLFTIKLKITYIYIANTATRQKRIQQENDSQPKKKTRVPTASSTVTKEQYLTMNKISEIGTLKFISIIFYLRMKNKLILLC